MTMTSADQIIEALELVPHPEGGAFRETFRSAETVDVRGGRSAATLIYFLLRAGDVSAWHRVLGSDEQFLYHGGDAYMLRWIDHDGTFHDEPVGMDIAAGELPRRVVPADCWQAAFPRPSGEHGWSLVGCLVSPGFDFADFEMATEAEVAARFPGLGESVALLGGR
ncbi:MAG TPA: cupin domain-containing protein [Capsulimonadaceae bacterium]|jgi:hypothetical protein